MYSQEYGTVSVSPEISDKKFRESYYIHNLERLLETADLNKALDGDVKNNPALDIHWTAVIRWDEKKCYETKILRQDAEGIINAIEDPVNGVLTWLKKRW